MRLRFTNADLFKLTRRTVILTGSMNFRSLSQITSGRFWKRNGTSFQANSKTRSCLGSVVVFENGLIRSLRRSARSIGAPQCRLRLRCVNWPTQNAAQCSNGSNAKAAARHRTHRPAAAVGRKRCFSKALVRWFHFSMLLSAAKKRWPYIPVSLCGKASRSMRFIAILSQTAFQPDRGTTPGSG